ncbi:MAG: CarD family transcriptional regulator [Desulfobacterales bacterium]|nr:CarD family transcriptional regulator [Desulfobacteraceae bacterium]MBT4363821.1 CarD family transcriptional regulator [Desulfobacteraceae bacterium]MBT7086146.1 CarD family transcriptional regulator [Desulfobacterales bacterium]MBT7697550.1 CarD family transcriptional regulator [Desulfobacterales bacterium]
MIKKIQIKNDAFYEFNQDDLAVYPAHGVGKINGIENRSINGEPIVFYIMQILESSMIIMIPIRNAKTIGLRPVIDKNEIPKIYNAIKVQKPAQINGMTWNRRYRDYMDKIKTGSLYGVAEVFSELYSLTSSKELAFGERKMLDMVQELLIKEISVVKNIDEQKVMKELSVLFEDS